ncbi:MAG: hypothetical protein MR806_00085 [Subdoligranulum sp.]|nr:hypothetical protein [Subdoligranulum sp.]
MCIIEHLGNADAVPQPPERCLSRQAGIVRCCPKPIERETLPGCQGYEVLPYDSCS